MPLIKANYTTFVVDSIKLFKFVTFNFANFDPIILPQIIYDLVSTDLVYDKPYNDHFRDYGFYSSVLANYYKSRLIILILYFLITPFFAYLNSFLKKDTLYELYYLD